MSEQTRILVVDDEVSIADLVATALRYEGFDVRTAGTAKDALAAIATFRPALVVLDVLLPDQDGFHIAQRLRGEALPPTQPVPILFLTARDATADKVRGLKLGGDDYVTKPFSVEELVARVEAILRRRQGNLQPRRVLSLADLELDDDSHEVRRAGSVIPLTSTEYRLLHYLLANAGRVLTRAQLLEHVWEYDFGGDASVLETYVSYLRRKIDVVEPPLLHTVRGVGYVLRLPRGA